MQYENRALSEQCSSAYYEIESSTDIRCILYTKESFVFSNYQLLQ